MKFAYNPDGLNNLRIVKEAKQWMVSGLISKEQYKTIAEQFPSQVYHPNFMIRILLMVATFVVLGAITGLLILMFIKAEDVLSFFSLIYGIVSLFVLDQIFLAAKKHYKSGITEAILYHSVLFIMLGFVQFFNESPTPYAVILTCLLAFTAFRYLDLISTIGSLCSFAWLVFYWLSQAGGAMQQVIPIVFIILFTPLYFGFKRLKKKPANDPWQNCLIAAEAVCLFFIYAAGNYFVVRELSIEMMNLDLQEGQDIPLAFVFYGLTVIIPILYLYFGLKNKDLVLLRVSLAVLAFSVFTFKYYFSLGHHEITLTVSGIILLAIAGSLLRWLKVPQYGYTRENILNEKWANSNAQAFIISQTLGATKAPEMHQFGGGDAGGGGAESKF